MPHCVLEHTDNIVEKINKHELFNNIHNVLMETGLFTLADIKSRIIVHHDYFIGNGDALNGFVTLAVLILSGRDEEIKKNISEKCLEVLKKTFAESLKQLKFSITVQIKDIEKASYRRITSD